MNRNEIPHALDHLKSAFETRLAFLFPGGIPEPVYDRYQKELFFLEQSDYIDDFEILRCLFLEAEKSSCLLSVRGTLPGSFLLFLLDPSGLNPLSPYYSCRACGFYEPVQTPLFGMDLPEKTCPCCGAPLTADGFRLSFETAWGPDGTAALSFESNINSEFLPFARRVLERLYPNRWILPWGIFQFDPASPGKPARGILPAGYVILPSERTPADYPNLISYLEDGDPCIIGGSWELQEHMMKSVRLLPLKDFDRLIQLQRASGIYARELTPELLRTVSWSMICNPSIPDTVTSLLFHDQKPKFFKDMAALIASAHNTFSWQNTSNAFDLPRFREMISSDNFQAYPCFTRDDVFYQLLDAGINRSLAYEASEMIRKGFACASSPQHDRFHSLPIPNDLKKTAANYRYLFPKAHCINYLMLYSRLAWYARENSRAFSRIVLKKGHPLG